MLIHPSIGSFFFLAEILLGIGLPPDPPFEADHCGSCTRCLDACPTGCILPDRTLDARSCVSYLTIENKGEIPADLRPAVGEWLFGCDVCQQVCPWNRFSSPEGDPEFAPRSGLLPEEIVKEFQLSAQDFNRKFKNSPIKRAKRRGYLRNISVVLGNRKSSAEVSSLKITIRDVEPLVRSHAAWALGQIGGEESTRILKEALKGELDASVREEINRALGQI
jgi:epoxyqueuosine reductase